MKHAGWDGRATSDESGTGISRRDALKRGTLLGLGLVWVTPQMSSFSMTAQFAQATSPVPETTEPEIGDTSQKIEDEVEDVEIENEAGEIEDEVLSGELPFTGLPVEQLLPLAGGALATGAAVVRAARERKERPEPAEEDQTDGI